MKWKIKVMFETTNKRWLIPNRPKSDTLIHVIRVIPMPRAK
jgi:hypothetical protein